MPTDPLPANLAPGAFAGTAEDYARYRPAYPSALLDHLLAATAGRGQLLDLACGPGRIALAIAHSFEHVLAVDAEPDMLDVGRRLADQRGLTNVTWRCARAEEVALPDVSVDLISIGEAFHRLDQKAVLALAQRWLKPGGVLATMGGTDVFRGGQPWQRKVFEVAEEWTRDAFPRGWAPALPASETESAGIREMLKRHGFIDVVDHEFKQDMTWAIDDVLGYLRSMSVCSPSVLGARRPAFEAQVRATLLDIWPGGTCRESLKFGLTVARKP